MKLQQFVIICTKCLFTQSKYLSRLDSNRERQSSPSGKKYQNFRQKAVYKLLCLSIFVNFGLISTGIYLGSERYSPRNNFGSNQVHIFLDCPFTNGFSKETAVHTVIQFFGTYSQIASVKYGRRMRS